MLLGPFSHKACRKTYMVVTVLESHCQKSPGLEILRRPNEKVRRILLISNRLHMPKGHPSKRHVLRCHHRSHSCGTSFEAWQQVL